MSIKIAIDGPAGAGKSSISKEVAKRLGLVYVDTGAMYRACGVYALENGIEITDEEITPHLDKINIDISYEEDGQHIFLNGVDVSKRIREPDATIASSKIAVIPSVRLKLVELQRKIANEKSVIMDGRDIGTYVLPDADFKIFLTASVAERAKRRYLEMKQKGMQCEISKVIEDIEFRDKNDSEREFAPLRQAEDAILVDTSELSYEESCDVLYSMVKEKLDTER
ncbi:MAG: (d)CMP kinase [Clostridia bacterium]|nr:(d)CMP kinase [Clostridia bacterium]